MLVCQNEYSRRSSSHLTGSAVSGAHLPLGRSTGGHRSQWRNSGPRCSTSAKEAPPPPSESWYSLLAAFLEVQGPRGIEYPSVQDRPSRRQNHLPARRVQKALQPKLQCPFRGYSEPGPPCSTGRTRLGSPAGTKSTGDRPLPVRRFPEPQKYPLSIGRQRIGTLQDSGLSQGHPRPASAAPHLRRHTVPEQHNQPSHSA